MLTSDSFRKCVAMASRPQARRECQGVPREIPIGNGTRHSALSLLVDLRQDQRARIIRPRSDLALLPYRRVATIQSFGVILSAERPLRSVVTIIVTSCHLSLLDFQYLHQLNSRARWFSRYSDSFWLRRGAFIDEICNMIAV